jgi:hypothetical protein
MTQARLISCLCGLALTAACATAPATGEIQGLEQFAEPCTTEPAPLSDADVAALVQAMPSADQRERNFWAPLALELRKCVAYERGRATSLLAAGQSFNDAVRRNSD